MKRNLSIFVLVTLVLLPISKASAQNNEAKAIQKEIADFRELQRFFDTGASQFLKGKSLSSSFALSKENNPLSDSKTQKTRQSLKNHKVTELKLHTMSFSLFFTRDKEVVYCLSGVAFFDRDKVELLLTGVSTKRRLETKYCWAGHEFKEGLKPIATSTKKLVGFIRRDKDLKNFPIVSFQSLKKLMSPVEDVALQSLYERLIKRSKRCLKDIQRLEFDKFYVGISDVKFLGFNEINQAVGLIKFDIDLTAKGRAEIRVNDWISRQKPRSVKKTKKKLY